MTRRDRFRNMTDKNTILYTMNEDGALDIYNDTYDITIHCESEKEQKEVEKILKTYHSWIPVEERLPEDDRYILLSFENFSLPLVGRYEENEEGGAFYIGDCDEEDTCISNDLYINAWMSLPEPYRPDLCRGCFGAANNDCQICDKGGKV